MKRDVDYMIELLRRFEEDENYFLLFPQTLDMDQNEYQHVQLLCDDGLVQQVSDSGYRITGSGHDFLDSIGKNRLDEIKEEMKDEYGSTPLEIVSSIGLKILKTKLGI